MRSIEHHVKKRGWGGVCTLWWQVFQVGISWCTRKGVAQLKEALGLWRQAPGAHGSEKKGAKGTEHGLVWTQDQARRLNEPEGFSRSSDSHDHGGYKNHPCVPRAPPGRAVRSGPGRCHSVPVAPKQVEHGGWPEGPRRPGWGTHAPPVLPAVAFANIFSGVPKKEIVLCWWPLLLVETQGREISSHYKKTKVGILGLKTVLFYSKKWWFSASSLQGSQVVRFLAK